MKINLLKTKVKSEPVTSLSYQTGQTVVDDSIHLSSISKPDSNAAVLTNLFLMFVFVGGLYYYEGYANGQFKKQSQKLSQEVAKLRSDVQKKKVSVDEAKVFKVKSDEFKRKIEAIRELSKTRLIELKALDYIQNIVPERLWFTEIVKSGNNFFFIGKTASGDDLGVFLKELEGSSFFKDILILRAKETKDKKEGTLVGFEIQATMRKI